MQQDNIDNSRKLAFVNLWKRFIGDVTLTDKEIESSRTDYWKCLKCSEINEISELICWKCDASRPDNYEHPDMEELKKNSEKEKQSGPLWVGLISFVAVAGVLLRDYFRYNRRNDFPDLFTIAFAVFFALLGVIMILYWLIRKINGK